jgi:hypothetical protein
MIGVLWLSLFAVADPEGGGGDVGEDLYRHSLLSNPIDLSIKYLK